MKEHVVSLTVGDYRRLLLRKPKAEIVKIDICGPDWSTLLLQIRDAMSRVTNPTEIITFIEFPAAEGTYSRLIDLLTLLTEPYSASKLTLTWGYAEVDSAQFRIVMYAG